MTTAFSSTAALGLMLLAATPQLCAQATAPGSSRRALAVRMAVGTAAGAPI